MARNPVAFSVAIDGVPFTALSATRLVGDFTLHNPGSCAVTVANVGASTGFTLASGKSLRLEGVDLSALAARAESSGSAHLAVSGTTGGIGTR